MPDAEQPGGVYYVTTPIYYVNGQPHIGSALTTVCCDVLARYHRLRGRRAWLLTGTDENATKVQEAAVAAGEPPLEFVSRLAEEFRSAWHALHVEFDDFIRTTEPRHVEAVQEFFLRLKATGDVYSGLYEGWYCVSDETFFREAEVEADRLCPNPECRKPLSRVQEENYFFRLSAYGDRLLEHIHANPGFLQPEFRRNEVIAFIEEGLRDMSITRANRGWGIPAPGEPDKVIYVWFDALINYLAATGWPRDERRYRDLWPADAHVVGKEIYVRFHATLWPAMLMALGLPLPRTVYGHGWWVDAEGKKQGKRTGGLPHPTRFSEELARLSGVSAELAPDAMRYLLLREMQFHGDSEFTRAGFYKRYNADLANDLGNVCNRTANMVARYCDGAVPEAKEDPGILALTEQATADCEAALGQFRFNTALEAVWRVISGLNRYIEEKAPWKLAKAGERAELQRVLYTCLEALRAVSVLVSPFMPAAAAAIRRQLGIPEDAEIRWEDARRPGLLQAGARIPSPGPLFPRIQSIPDLENATVQTEPTDARTPDSGTASSDFITIDDFMKVQLRVATIEAAEPVPNATRLLKLTVNLGDETRTLLAGIAEMYQPDELIGRQIVVVANLQPRRMRGIESQGMLLAADVDGQAILLQPETPVPAGARVR